MGNNSMSSHISGIKSHFSKSKKVELSLGVVVVVVVGGGGVWHQTPPTTTTSNFDKKIFQLQKSSWSLGVWWWGGGGCLAPDTPHHHHLKLWQESFLSPKSQVGV